MQLIRRASLLVAMMVAATLAAVLLRPSYFLAESRNAGSLDEILPTSFDGWMQDLSHEGRVVDPNVEAQLSTVYSSTLTRTYMNDRGERVMLALAYGRDQRGEGRAHYPEVCYPAQGFQIDAKEIVAMSIVGASVPVTRLVARQEGRTEPVTYWLTVGNELVLPGLNHKIAVVSHGIRGLVPDGMLVRISSIGGERNAGFALHQRFAASLIAALPEAFRPLFIGTMVP